VPCKFSDNILGKKVSAYFLAERNSNVRLIYSLISIWGHNFKSKQQLTTTQGPYNKKDRKYIFLNSCKKCGMLP